MADVDMKALLEAGVHFGHRTQKWNPKMKPYIFTERNGIHIIDLQQTAQALDQAYALVRDLVAKGGVVLFVGTKRQAVETIEMEAERAEMPHVTVRWLGGMLTNWQTMRQRINELERLERMRERGDFERITKREALSLTRQIDKLQERFGGIRNITRPPDLLFIVDVRREDTAVREANILGIPVLGLVDTNCDPGLIDHVIPSNDDAIRAIKLMVAHMADAVIEGRSLRKDEDVEKPKKAGKEARRGRGAQAEELSDEELLGAATLAKVAEAQAEAEAAAEAEAKALAEKEAQAELDAQEAASEEEVEAEIEVIEVDEDVVAEESAEKKPKRKKSKEDEETDKEKIEEKQAEKKASPKAKKEEPVEDEGAEEKKPAKKKPASKAKKSAKSKEDKE